MEDDIEIISPRKANKFLKAESNRVGNPIHISSSDSKKKDSPGKGDKSGKNLKHSSKNDEKMTRKQKLSQRSEE